VNAVALFVNIRHCIFSSRRTFITKGTKLRGNLNKSVRNATPFERLKVELNGNVLALISMKIMLFGQKKQ